MADQKNEILHEPPLLFPFGKISNDITQTLLGIDVDSLSKAQNDADNEKLSTITPEWKNYFTNQRNAFNQFFPPATIQDTNGITHVSVPKAPELTTSDRDNIQNPSNGMTIYNTTTQKMNWYENGSWVEK